MGSKKLEKYLQRTETTRFQLAVALGVSPSTVHYWLQGSTPRQGMRVALAKLTRGDVPVSAWG